MKLTELSIRSIKSPAGSAQIYYDDSVRGFGIRVTKTGVKSFVLTHGTRRQRETIGRVGIVTLSDARDEAKRRLAEYTLGKERPRIINWNNARDEYLSQIMETCRASTHYEYERLLKKHFRFGETKLIEISPYDLHRQIDKLRRAEKAHAYTVVRAFIRWAYRRHYLEKNPMDRMIAPPGSKPRKRVLSPTELTKTLTLALQGTSHFHSIVALCLLLGQRRSEVAALQWSWIDLEEKLITLPGRLTKNGEDHTFPIGDLAVRVLKSLDQSGLYVFPAARERFRGQPVTTFNGWTTPKVAFDKQLGIPHWTLHDLRRSLRTYWAELGVFDEVAETYINHISGKRGGLNRIYNHAKYKKPMRQAVMDWEFYLLSLIADSTEHYGKRVPLMIGARDALGKVGGGPVGEVVQLG
jgi:integrase